MMFVKLLTNMSFWETLLLLKYDTQETLKVLVISKHMEKFQSPLYRGYRICKRDMITCVLLIANLPV